MAEILGLIVQWLKSLGLSGTQGILLIVIIGIFFTIFQFIKNNNFWSIFKKKNRFSVIEYYKIIDSKKKLMEANRDKLYKSIIQKQMDYAEQKLVELILIFISDFADKFKNTKDSDEIYIFLIHLKERFKDDQTFIYKIDEIIENFSNDKEISQKKLYYWFFLFEIVEKIIKLEFKRSFIENGFHNITESDFIIYIQNRSKKITALIKQTIINNYPKSSGIVVTQDQVLNQIDQLQSEFSVIIEDVYREVKKIKLEIESQIKIIECEFNSDVSEFDKLV